MSISKSLQGLIVISFISACSPDLSLEEKNKIGLEKCSDPQSEVLYEAESVVRKVHPRIDWEHDLDDAYRIGECSFTAYGYFSLDNQFNSDLFAVMNLVGNQISDKVIWKHSGLEIQKDSIWGDRNARTKSLNKIVEKNLEVNDSFSESPVCDVSTAHIKDFFDKEDGSYVLNYVGNECHQYNVSQINKDLMLVSAFYYAKFGVVPYFHVIESTSNEVLCDSVDKKCLQKPAVTDFIKALTTDSTELPKGWSPELEEWFWNEASAYGLKPSNSSFAHAAMTVITMITLEQPKKASDSKT